MQSSWKKYSNDHKSRPSTPKGVWNIPISMDDLSKQADARVEKLNIPGNYTRKRLEAKIRAMIDIIKSKATPSKRELRVGDWVYYRKTKDLTRGNYWPYEVENVEIGKIERVSPKTYTISNPLGTVNSRVYHEHVLGRMSARRG